LTAHAAKPVVLPVPDSGLRTLLCAKMGISRGQSLQHPGAQWQFTKQSAHLA